MSAYGWTALSWAGWAIGRMGYGRCRSVLATAQAAADHAVDLVQLADSHPPGHRQEHRTTDRRRDSRGDERRLGIEAEACGEQPGRGGRGHGGDHRRHGGPQA